MTRRVPALLAVAVLALTTLTAARPSVAAEAFERVERPGTGIVQHETGDGAATYVVVLQAEPLALYAGGLPGLPATSPAVTGQERLDPASAASRAYLAFVDTLHARLLHGAAGLLGVDLEPRFRYRTVLNGVALELAPGQARRIATLPGVARVVRETPRWLETDAGPEWIGAPQVWEGTKAGGGPVPGRPDRAKPGVPATQGEGVVVGVIDTGVNHDHPSFADIGPVDGYDHDNPTGRYFGVCTAGGTAVVVSCNDKLIGIYDFTGTGPEDDNGHGSHTASTVAGNVLDAVIEAPSVTETRRISGVAPHANIISYKGCSGSIVGCQLPALVAAIDTATLDGVDVINYSIGGGSTDPWTDLDALAFLGARAAGTFVATSAGNSGPGSATLGSPADAPWVTSVAASTHHRKLFNALTDLAGPDGPFDDIVGQSLTGSLPSAPIVYAGDFGDADCGEGSDVLNPANPFAPGTFDGMIVVCDRGTYARTAKAQVVADAGAAGFVLANDEASGDSTVGDAYVIPGVHIGYEEGEALKAWIGGDTSGAHSAAIQGTRWDEDPANGDVMASFSSRGPNPSAGDVLKPDVTAPGVDVLAAVSSYAAEPDPVLGLLPLPPLALPPTGTEPEFGIVSGTSMSSPHVAGAAALVRAARPGWSPDAIKAALTTTAFDGAELEGSQDHDGDEVHPVLKEDGVTPSDPFDRGAGRIAVDRAVEAGLVVEETPEGYLAANPLLGGAPGALNVPSLAEDLCDGICTWTRTVTATDATDRAVTWRVETGFDGAGITVDPATFTLEPGQSQELTVTADVRRSAGWRFGVVRLVPDRGLPTASLPVAAWSPEEPQPSEDAEPAQPPIEETVLAPLPGLGLVAAEGVTEATVEFTVEDGYDNAELQVLATPALPADVDLYLERVDGGEVARGASANLTEERLTYGSPSPGAYRLVVHNWAGALASVDVTITFYNSAGEPGVGAPRSSPASRFLRSLR